MVREIIGAILIIASMGSFCYAVGIIVACLFTRKEKEQHDGKYVDKQ